MYPYGNLSAVDTLFFGCSSSTESGLNTVDVNKLKTYQQVYIYVIPTITNMMFINAMVVPMRLYWFRQRLKKAGVSPPSPWCPFFRLASSAWATLELTTNEQWRADQCAATARSPAPLMPVRRLTSAPSWIMARSQRATSPPRPRLNCHLSLATRRPLDRKVLSHPNPRCLNHGE